MIRSDIKLGDHVVFNHQIPEFNPITGTWKVVHLDGETLDSCDLESITKPLDYLYSVPLKWLVKLYPKPKLAALREAYRPLETGGWTAMGQLPDGTTVYLAPRDHDTHQELEDGDSPGD